MRKVRNCETCGVPTRSSQARFCDECRELRPRPHPKRYEVTDYLVEDRGYTTPCWVMDKKPTAHGYVHISVNRREVYAHRVMYERVVGPVPDGLQLDHLCRVRACVRPDHLEPVTAAKNVQRGRSTKLTVEQVRRARYGRESAIALAAEFGVSRQAIHRIRWGVSWKGV